jgi:hypothetical protein
VRGRRGTLVAVVLTATLAVAGSAYAAEEGTVVEEVLGILKERGLVDDQEYQRLVMKNASYEKKEQEGFLSRIDWSGDFRFRMENFWYDRDARGFEQSERTRLRYRLRIKGEVPINEYISTVFRLASGEKQDSSSSRVSADPRSTNRTLGRDNDFGNDGIFLDLAYVELRAPSGWMEDTEMKGRAGKVPNPFRWKNGKDYMMWDSDITPEGVGFQLTSQPTEKWKLFLNTGYFIADENSSSKDPHVLGIQGGFGVTPNEEMEYGARLTWYNWRSLDSSFFGRSANFGSLPGGLTDGSPTSSNDGMSVGELGAYFRYKGIEDWPMLLYGHYAQNFDAESTTFASDQDTGWGFGLEVGDKKKYAKLGTGYYELEANFWPAQFVDSNLFDGRTNGKGWTFYGSREILPHTDLNVTLFYSDELEDEIPPFGQSVANAKRYRLQTDLVVKF